MRAPRARLQRTNVPSELGDLSWLSTDGEAQRPQRRFGANRAARVTFVGVFSPASIATPPRRSKAGRARHWAERVPAPPGDPQIGPKILCPVAKVAMGDPAASSSRCLSTGSFALAQALSTTQRRRAAWKIAECRNPRMQRSAQARDRERSAPPLREFLTAGRWQAPAQRSRRARARAPRFRFDPRAGARPSPRARRQPT